MLALIGSPEPDRDSALPEAAWQSIAANILTGVEAPANENSRAAALRLQADDHALEVFSPAERSLMREWLGRVADA